nr:FAD/NAD(P)-binding protein [Acetobacter fallax]
MKVKIVIVGGGASGALAALQLAQWIAPTEILVVEPRAQIGRGIAYSTQNPAHLLNVRAGNISVFPDKPDDFVSWLQEKTDFPADPSAFAPRRLWGEYLTERFEETGIRHCHASVRQITVDDKTVCLTLKYLSKSEALQDAHDSRGALPFPGRRQSLRHPVELKGTKDATPFYGAQGNAPEQDNPGDFEKHPVSDDQTLITGKVILATGHFLPVDVPQISETVRRDGRYIRNIWDQWPGLPETHAPVVLIGTGLTAVDALLRLRSDGYQGTVIMISRHGLLSSSHGPAESVRESVIPPETPPSALAYLKAFRQALASGQSWRAGVDSLRGVSNHLWARLPSQEKQRFRRHLLHLWNTSRHRMAPQVAHSVTEDLARGRLIVRKGNVYAIEDSENSLSVKVRVREGTDSIQAALVMNCSGPDTNYKRVQSPVLNSLFKTGLAKPDESGVALATDAKGALINASGNVSNLLYAIGPLRAGSLFETTAIPEIRQQAGDFASLLSEE